MHEIIIYSVISWPKYVGWWTICQCAGLWTDGQNCMTKIEGIIHLIWARGAFDCFDTRPTLSLAHNHSPNIFDPFPPPLSFLFVYIVRAETNRHMWCLHAWGSMMCWLCGQMIKSSIIWGLWFCTYLVCFSPLLLLLVFFSTLWWGAWTFDCHNPMDTTTTDVWPIYQYTTCIASE